MWVLPCAQDDLNSSHWWWRAAFVVLMLPAGILALIFASEITEMLIGLFPRRVRRLIRVATFVAFCDRVNECPVASI